LTQENRLQIRIRARSNQGVDSSVCRTYCRIGIYVLPDYLRSANRPDSCGARIAEANLRVRNDLHPETSRGYFSLSEPFRSFSNQ
jgi:hypothetical protein